MDGPFDEDEGGHFDAVVVGSGFGGSVMAYRLAEAGLSVCVLERGRAYPPGSFPRSPYRMRSNFWDPSRGLHGLFSLWSFTGLDAVVSSGLGGGSLIYANVLLRKDPAWFVQDQAVPGGGTEHWPVGYDDLVPHYERVEAMMNVQRYPVEHEPYRSTPKTVAFRAAAERAGLAVSHPKLAVTFANRRQPPKTGEPITGALGKNLHGKTRYTCRLCGECDVGCNYGSKNTLDYTYLTAAWRLGAKLRPLREVRSFERTSDGRYAVRYVRHRPDPAKEFTDVDTRDESILPLHAVTADRLILAAGTLGTTYLLLNNRSAFPGLSDRLGARFCGNGDLLTFALGATDQSADPVVPTVIEASRGPVITSTVRVDDELDGPARGAVPGDRGFYLQDAGYPELVTWLVEAINVPSMTKRQAKFGFWLLRNRLRRRPDTDLSAEVASLFGPCTLSNGVLPLLGMGRDIPDGKMDLLGGRLRVDWVTDKSGPYFDRVRACARRLTDELGAKFVDNPIWFARRVITVHPLGGCPMGRSHDEGVVDTLGRVFDRSGPVDDSGGVYPGLYVADGSIMPGPVGPNPSLTIAAMADRIADGIIAAAVADGASAERAAEPVAG